MRTPVAFAETLPLRDIAPVRPRGPVTPKERIEHEPPDWVNGRGQPGPLGAAPERSVLKNFMGPVSMPATAQNFAGIGDGFTGPQGTYSVNSAPPDTNGDVGPNHYVQWVNTDLTVFNKSGTPVLGPVAGNTLFSALGGGCASNNDGDPLVLYDPLADRWFLSQFSVNTTPYLQCVAVSKTPDPTGAWYTYAFSYGTTRFNDYGKGGVWPDGYYLMYHIFNNGSTWAGTEVCALDRVKMISGNAGATQQCFGPNVNYGGLLPSHLNLQGSQSPPAGAPNYFMAFGASGQLLLWPFHVDWATPANSTFPFATPKTITVAAFTEACAATGTCIPQNGGSSLDSLGDRLMWRLNYRNSGTAESLVVNHSVTSGGVSGVRWYEIRSPGAVSPVVFQQGTYQPDTTYRWMGSVNMDRQGNMAVGYSASSSTVNPQIRYAGRLVGDAAGTLPQAEATIIAGAGAQNGGLSRWGDYSSMSVDPSDGCTYWFTSEYLAATGSFNWQTRIASFKYPGCTSCNPAQPTASSSGAVCPGQTLTLSTPAVAGATYSWIGPNGFTSSAQNPSIPGVTAAASGLYSLTVTVAGCTSLAGTVSVTVAAGTPPTTASAGGPKTICPGGTTAGLGGNTPSVGTGSWSVLSGGTGTFSPNATTPGATFTHTGGSGPVTLRWTISNSPCAVSTADVAVTVTPAPAVTAVLPANASSGFVGSSLSWTTAGTTANDVYFDTVNPPQKLLVVGTAAASAPTPVWFSSTPYYWRIVSHGPCGTATSPVYSFTTGTCGFTGALPALTAPANAATGVPIATTLTWSALAGTSHYDVYLGTTNPPTARYQAVYDPAVSLPVFLAPGKTYYWQVKAVPTCGNGAAAASAVRSFTTASSSLALSSVSPAFLNRWTGGSLSVLGSGFLATTTPFTDLYGRSAGTYTLGPWTSVQVDGTVAADTTAPAGRYDVGVTDSGTERGRLVDALAVRAFTDVDETSFFFESSSRVADAGIMESDFDAGTSGPQFVPTTVVTRALMAEYLGRAYQWMRTRSTALPAATCVPSGGGSSDFPDVPCSHPDWLAIHWIKTWGITAGAACVPGPGVCYLPDGSVTRGQMATFLMRLQFGPEGTGTVLQGFLNGLGTLDPGCGVPYPSCSGWTDPQLQVPAATWPHAYVNVTYEDRVTNGCSGTVPPFGFCTGVVVTRGQMAEFLGRAVGLVPTP